MKHTILDPDAIRKIVRENYGKIADTFGSCCNSTAETACCDRSSDTIRRIGYSEAQVQSADQAADMSLGCGNPQAIAGLKTGETVLDLGSGAGFDAILAAKAVGPAGQVIGIDMTDSMIRKARRNVKKAGCDNVIFRIGEIEHLPVDESTVDVIISNCVINLSPDKRAVFHEAHRVLKPYGRLAISDVVAIRPLPAKMQTDPQLYCACIGGAALVDELQQVLKLAGFEKIRITTLDRSKDLIKEWIPGKNAQDYVVSAFIEAVKSN